MDQISTKDVFRAAYLFSTSNRTLSISFDQNGQKRYIIKGEKLLTDVIRYYTGKALVNPLVFEKSYRFLDEVGPQLVMDLGADFSGIIKERDDPDIESDESAESTDKELYEIELLVGCDETTTERDLDGIDLLADCDETSNNNQDRMVRKGID